MPSLVTAIDIGSENIKVASVRRRGTKLQVVGAGLTPLPAIERSSPQFPSEVAAALQRLIRKHEIPVGFAVVGLAGRGTMVRYLTLPAAPPWKLKLAMAFEVEEQIGSAAGAQQVAHDYRILNLPGFDPGQFPIFLALAQSAVVEERLAVCRAAGYTADDVDLLCLGVSNLFAASPLSSGEETILLLDIGAEETNLALQRGANLLFARTLSLGGRQFTAAVQQRLGLLGPEAEEWKRSQACLLPREEEEFYTGNTLEASRACRAEVGQFARSVQSALGFFQTQFKLKELKPQRVLITGGGSRLKGLAPALGEFLGCEAAPFDPAAHVEAVGASAREALSAENSHHFAAAIGLAAGRLSDGMWVSLLPLPEKAKRRFWAREVYAIYTAIFAFLLLVLLFASGRREVAYRQERQQAWQLHLEKAKASHQTLAKLEEEHERHKRRLRALIEREASGQDLVLCLRELQNATPPDIFLTHLRTAEGWQKAEGGKDEPSEIKPTVSFQENRFVYLHGYVIGAENEKAARERISKAYLGDLGKSGFFSKIEIIEIAPLARDEIARAFAVRLFDDAEGKARPAAPPPRGVASSFVLRCTIRERQ